MMPTSATSGAEFTRTRGRAADFISLTKPRILMMVLLTACAGFYIGSGGTPNYGVLWQVLIGTALAAGGTLALNQFLERDLDGRMTRTQLRPLPAGRLHPAEALLFGVLLTVAGLLYLAAAVNTWSSVAAAVTAGSYLFLYTPLKRKTALCVMVGAVPGALPPVIGWAAATGRLGSEACVLFAILFLWQLPHTLAIAMLHKDDYKRAGIRLLPLIDPDDILTRCRIICDCLILLAVSLLPTLMGFAGPFYFVGAFMLGISLLGCACACTIRRSTADVRRLAFASLVQLPALFLLMVLDRVPL
ncbi:MAG: protoheme IX farnesyltransferase [Candidatus Methylomirabilis oxygeniifera]|uniref:Protoheme IX farnesyltransferase n=1 Tax=Methylomirabilis oxygeniifera TaxID=671143 RepID=D5MG36_METO1|nr:MAG: protoheme IX farnesyltransferase [Candidatus Methylomirabilis oxyfera]CBE68717.1 Protoheme IX farnesyltransferase (Heme O synthase) (Heme B farnesyltransferase) [Candidatus Methylomirabilis oxyfera]